MTSKLFGNVSSNVKQQPEPFELHVEEQRIQHLKTLLQLSPIAKDTYENQSRDLGFGVSRKWLSDAKTYWEKDYDWRKQEAHINSFPNFKQNVTDDDGKTFQIHFAALFSERKDAIPLVFLHGWPGSFLEFLPIMDIVRKKYSPRDSPFHIIAPSLLGYGLSQPPPLDKDWRIEDTARVTHKLLLSLGFGETGYIVQGGDIGSFVARTIAATYPECKAMHLNFMFMLARPEGVAEDATTEQERRGLRKMDEFQATGNAYGRMHGTRPATIGHILSSSPVALLSWVGEKFLEWTDDDLPLDTVLADISLYWFTESFPTSIYTYRQDFTARDQGYFHGLKGLYVDKPVGYSYFPQEIIPIPKSWAETTGRLVHFRRHEKGGHFAALERPAELWGDIEDFVKQNVR